MNENALNTFYNNIVKSDTTFSADYDTFKNGMQDANVRKELYKRLRESNSNFPSNDYDVDAVLGFQTKFDNAASKATNKAVSELRNDKYASLTDDELDNQWNNMLSKGEQKKSERIASAKNEMERFEREHPFLNAIGKIQGQGVSKLPSQSITPIEAIESQHASQFLDESDLEEFKALDKERGVRGHESGHAGIRETTMNAQNIVEDIRDKASRDDKPLSGWDKVDLNMAERINTKAQELVDAPSKYGEEAGVSNWWQGLSDTLFDRDIISVVGMVRDMNVSHVVQKLNDGKELSDSENALIVAVANFDEVQERRSSDLSVGYQIGQGTAQCVPLIIDMMITKGLGAAGKSALIKNLDKLVKAGKMSQKSLDRFARVLNGAKGVSYTSGKKDNAVRVTVGALEDGAKKTFGQYAGDVARELIETGIQTYAMPSSQRQMIQEKTDLRRKTGENDIAFKDRARIFGNAYTQTFTERAGGKAIDWTLGKVFGMTNVLQKFGFDRGILKLLNDAVQNPISEIGEEYLGAIINLVRSTDLFDLYSEQSNEELRDDAMSMFTSEGFWQTVGTTLPMSLFGGAANYSAIKAETRKYNKSNLELSQYLQNTGMTKSQAENILRQIEGAKDSNEFKERMSILKTYLTNYIMENNNDTGIAKGKLEGMNTLLDTYSQNIESYEEAIGGLKYALSSMSKEDKEKVATDFKTLVDKANKSITATPQTDGKDITPANKQSAGWAKRKYTVTIDGKKENITVQGELFFNEDGSINSTQTEMGKVHIQNEQGKNIRTTVKADKKKEIFDKYLDAINDELRKQKAQKDAETLATQKAEEARKAELARIKAEEKAKLENENAKLEAEKGAIAQLEAEKQTILGSLPKDKQGEVSEKDMKPEQKVLYWQQEDTPETVVKNLTDQLVWEEQQISSIQGKDMSPADKVFAIRKHKNSIKAYEQAITKWLGQETLDAINAARAQALQNTPPIQGEAPAAPVQAPVVEPAQDETPADAPAGPDTTPLPLPGATVDEAGTEGEGEGDGETPAPDMLGEEGGVEGNEEKEKIIDVVQDMEAGRIKAYYSKNGGGQWYVTKDGVVVAKSEGAKQSGMPNNAKEVTAKLLYLDVNGNKEPVILITSQQDYTKVRGGVKIVNEYGIKDADSQSLFSREVDEKGKESFKQINKRVSGFAKLKTLDELLSYPLLIRGENKYFTMKDLFELGYKNAKTTTGNNKVLTPYQQVREMVINDNPTYDDEQIDLAMRHFANQFQEAATRWNEIIDSTIIPNLPQELENTDELKIANTNINTGKTGDKQTAIASFMNALGTAWEFGVVDTDVNLDVINTIPKRFNDLRKDSRVKDRSLKLVLSDLKNLEKELNNEKGIHQYEDNEEGIKKARKKLTNYISQLSDTQVQALANHNDVKVLAELDVTRKYINERLGKITPQSPTKPAPNKKELEEKLTALNVKLREMEAEYKDVKDRDEREELEGFMAKVREDIAKLKAEIDGAEFMVGDVVAEHAESTKRIIKIIKAAGIRVITFKNEDLPKYVSKKKLEELSDGQIVYGFASNDTIYLNEDHFNPNSPLHEFTHLWVTAYKQAFPNEWKRFVEIANKSALAANLRKPLKDGNASPYAKLSADEMASEVLSRYTGYLYGELDAEGRTAFENMMQAQTMEEKIAEKSLLNRIRNIWKKIISLFDKSIENEKKEDVIDDMIRQFAQRPMETLARGKEAVDELKQIAKQGYKVQSVYHGTAVEFDQFNHDFMGSGEGAQAYGWGTYVSQVKDIAVSYAKKIAGTGDRVYGMLDQYSRKFGERYGSMYEVLELYYSKARNNSIYSLEDLEKEIQEKIETHIRVLQSYIALDYPNNNEEIAESIKTLARKYINKQINDREFLSIIKPFPALNEGDMYYELQALKRVYEMDDTLKFIFNNKNIFDEVRKIIEDNTQKNRHLYEVQIPSDAYIEDGSIDLENSPYLGWDDTYPVGSKVHNLTVSLINELAQEFDILRKLNTGQSRGRFTNDDQRIVDRYYKLMLDILPGTNINKVSISGNWLYSLLIGNFGSPKAASEWLLSQGIVGVRVSTGATSGKKRDTKNYVIFNEADAHIVNHTAFMIGEDGKLMLNNMSENLDNSKKSSTFAENNENYERTDEFRELQERSLGLSQSDIARYQSEQIVLSDEDKRGIGGVFQRLMESERNGGRNGQWVNLTGKGNQFKMAQVNPAIFHDIFQICRNYLPNGELVDLHDNYADCKCFISEDGLCGFAIEPNGNLISVFSLNPSDKKGFLYAIKDLIRQEGATHLDCFVSNKQPLSEIYQKVLGFHVASEMDYNMEYDHDNIAENHGMPKVAFMVDKPTEKREFDKDSYDAAAEYQLSQTSTAEREQIIADAKANGTFMMHNGQPTNLTEDQWVTVRTQAFKDYFGDWINDKDNASVVLDENGEPLVVYHGSRMAGFDKFGRGEARDSQGIYTTPNRRAAESYATSAEEWRSGQTMPEAELGVPDHHGVYSLFVNMRNPKVIDFGGKEFDRFGTPKYEVATNEALNYGERGILFDTLEEAEAYIAEHPEEDLDYVEKYTTSDELLVQAKEEGYDGVIFTNIIDSRSPDPITNYVPFEPNQVKSATQNVGTFNPEDDRIEFMIGPAAVNETEEKIKKASEDVESAFVTADVPLPDKTNALAKLATAVCDSGEAFRQFMKALRKYRKKNHLGKLPEGRDIRQIYDNQRVVLKNKVTELLNLYETPLLETLDKLIKVVENSSMYQKYQEDKVVYTIEEEDADGKITTKTWTDYVEITPREFIERYLIACDSVERLNNGIPPRGLREFYSRMGVNVYDFQMEFEAAFASDGEGEALVKELWKRINAYTNYTLEDSYECGMLTEEEYNKRKARKFYVPERDFQAEKELEQTEIKPQKHYRSNKLASSKQAKGGNSLAANIIENMIHIGNIDLSKNNKNRVKLAMFNLLKENEDFRRSIGLPKPEEVWYDSDGKRVSNKPSKTLIERIKWLESQIAEYDSLIAIEESQAVPDTVEIAQLEKETQDLIDERNSIPYMLEYDARDKFFGENNPHMVGVYVDGVLCSMQFPNMSLIATALNDTWADSLAVRDVLKRISGYMGSIITSYEPSFFAVNTVTDSIAILTKGYVELGTEYAARFIATTKDLGKHMSLITAYMTGKDYRSMENGDLFRDFLMNGGNTGYATIRNMEEILRELQVLDNNSNHIKDGVKWTKKALSFTNESAELLLRFAAYKAAIDCGYGIEKATWAANNLSANFNRTGKKFNDTKFRWRALGEAMEWFRSLSMFTNPSIQGAMSYLRMFGDSGELSTKERVAKYFRLFNAAMFMPALCGFLNAMMFDDDEQEEWAVSEYDRANYLVLGKLGKWAVPHMLRPFYNIGVNIAMGMQGRRTGGDIADSIITSFLTHLTPLPPVLTETASKGVHSAFGNADFTFFDGIESLVSPQGINTLKELADGENFLGYKIRYEGSTAQYTKNPNAGAFEKIIAEQFYIWGGGIEGSDSKITNNGNTIGRFWDVSPNEVKSVMQLFLPKLVIDVANITAGSISEEHDVRLKDIPIVNRFVSDRTKEAYRAGIYSEANKVVKANEEIAKEAKGDITRLKIDFGKASSEEERVRIQNEIDFYEGIHKQAKGDVFAVTIDKNLEKYKRIRMASLHKKYHHDEKSFKELYPDLRYDVIEDAEKMFTFNMFQLICMYNGTGKVNDNLPNWMKDVFRMKPSTQEVNQMWEHYQKLQEENNERLGLSEQ